MNLHGLVIYNENYDVLGYLQYNQAISTVAKRSLFQLHISEEPSPMIHAYSDITYLEADGWQVIGDMGDEFTVAQLN
jgi:hypothetical protein